VNNYQENKINRCQPGYNASCSLCCGSHNYAMPASQIEDLLSERAEKIINSAPKHPYVSCFEKLFSHEVQCQNVGVLPDDPVLVGCLSYAGYGQDADFKSFFKGTCKTFLCAAWDDLTDRQVLFAAELMHDWYYYSLLINNIEAVHDICALYDSPEDVPLEELELLKESLVEMFIEEDGK
jgi:hypothetical protein